MALTSNTNIIYNGFRSIADTLRTPFYQWRSHGTTPSFISALLFKAPIMLAGLLASLPFRKISIWAAPKEGFVTTKTTTPGQDVSNKVTVLSYNILGMPSYHAAKEQRPPIKERLDEVFRIIEESNADVVMLQEVHAGSELENAIMERLKDKYSQFYRDMGQKVFFHGSGLMVFSKYKNVDFEFHAFDKAAEIETRKGFGVLTIKDNNDKAVMRIADTHFQSGKSDKVKQIRREQTQQIIDFAHQTADVPFFFAGDLNIDRNDVEYTADHPLHHSQAYISDGFENDEARAKPTLADFEGQTTAPKELAVDNILGVNTKGKWEMKIEQRGTFANKATSPSDHAAMLATLTRV